MKTELLKNGRAGHAEKDVEAAVSVQALGRCRLQKMRVCATVRRALGPSPGIKTKI